MYKISQLSIPANSFELHTNTRICLHTGNHHSIQLDRQKRFDAAVLHVSVTRGRFVQATRNTGSIVVLPIDPRSFRRRPSRGNYI